MAAGVPGAGQDDSRGTGRAWAALQAEARAGTGPVTVPLPDGGMVEVAPLWDWPTWAIAALSRDDYDPWARECLPGAGYPAWVAADLSLAEIDAFFEEWGRQTGQSLDDLIGVADFAARYCEPIEADLRQYYRIDLRDLWRPGGGQSGLTWRGLKLLIDHLPPESATKTAARDDIPDGQLAKLAQQDRQGHGRWASQDYLLAHLSDQVGSLIYVTAASFGGKPAKPVPLPRPGLVTASRKHAPTEADLGRLQAIRAARGGPIDAR